MKKILVAVLVIIALVLLVLPGAVGVVAENQFRKVSGNVQEVLPGLTWQVTDYQRGWFKSRAQYRLRVDPASLAQLLAEEETEFGQPFTLRNSAAIYHGPFFTAALLNERVPLSPALAHSIDSLEFVDASGTATVLPGAVSTRLGLTGRHRNLIDIQPVTIPIEEDGKVGRSDWAGMRMLTHFNSALDDFRFDGKIGKFELNMPQFQLDMSAMDFEGEQQLTEYGFWSGRQTGHFGGLRIDVPDRAGIALGPMTWDGHISVAGAAVEEDVVFEMERLEIAGWQGGPLVLSARIGGLNAPALGELLHSLQLIAGHQEPGEEAQAEILAAVQALLASGPDMHLRELRFGTPDGDLLFTAHVVFPESDPHGLGALILGLDATASLRLPTALVDRLAALNPDAHAQLQGLQAAGLLLLNDDHLSLDAALKGGLLTINGQPLPLPMSF